MGLKIVRHKWETEHTHIISTVFVSNAIIFLKAAAAAKSLQSCPTLCNPIDGLPPGSPVPGILQARTLEQVAIFFSNEWNWKVKVKLLSRVRLLETSWTAAYQAPPSMGFSRQEYWSGLPLPSPFLKLIDAKKNKKKTSSSDSCYSIQYFISLFVDTCLINLWFLPFYYMDNAERYFPLALFWMCGYLTPASGARKCYLKSLSFSWWRLSRCLLRRHTLFTCTLLCCTPQTCSSDKLKARAKSFSAIFLKAFAHVMSLNYLMCLR